VKQQCLMKMNTSLLVFCVIFCCGVVGALVVPSTDSHLLYQGRWFQNSTAATADWAGTTVSLTFSGSTTVAFNMSTSASDWVNIFVINNATGEYVINVGQAVSLMNDTAFVNISTTLDSTVTYRVIVNKRTEALWGIVYFFGFQLDDGATLLATQNLGRRVELVGASMINGYTNLDNYLCVTAIPSTENSWLSYGPDIARNYSAEWHMEAWSGKGVIVNSDGSTVNTVPEIFNRTIANDASYGYWNFASWTPDLIIFNVGTNDFSTTPPVNSTLFIAAYIAFVQQMSTYYTNNPAIIITCGPRLNTTQLCPVTKQAAEALNLPYVDYTNTLLLTDTSCQGHPTVSGDAKMAAQTLPTVATVMASKWNLQTSTTSAATTTTSAAAATTGTATGAATTASAASTGATATTATATATSTTSAKVTTTTSTASATVVSVVSFVAMVVVCML